MGIIDAVVLVGYLLGITTLGIWMARRVHNSSDFFMPRRFGKATMIMHAFGSGTASDQAVAVVSGTFQYGVAGIWLQWQWMFATPFYWLIAPIMRRFRAVTTADVYTLRFDRSIAVLFALVGAVGMSSKIGLMLIGSSAVVDAATNGLIPTNVGILIITVLFVVYGAAGGLGAAIMTDFIQGFLTIVFSFLLLPIILAEVGGLSGVKKTITDPKMMSVFASESIGLFFIIMLSILVIVGIVAQPHIMGVCAAGRDESDGRVGFMVGNFLKRFCTIAWCLTGIAALAWYANKGADLSTIKGDSVYGDMAKEFLPSIFPGLLGIFLASLLAVVMSSCDSFMIAASGLFTRNIYKPWRTGRSEDHYVWVGRISGVVVVVGGVLFAVLVNDVVKALLFWLKIAPLMGIAFWLGLFWRRTTVAGAWASFLAASVTWLLMTQKFFANWVAGLPFAESLHLVTPLEKGFKIYDPWQNLLILSVGTLAGIIVSLYTRPVDKERLDRFYALTRTPIQKDEQIKEPCTLPEGVEPAERKMITTAFGLEIPVPSRTSVIGFVAGWVAVGLLIGLFVWIVS